MEKWIIWCDLNAEQDALKKLFGDNCVSIQGSTPSDKRTEMEEQWREGKIPILISKPKVFGHGMNWQHCNNVAFVGLSDSYEAFYQAVRRCWRFGQKKDVNVHIITAHTEGAVVANIERKERDAMTMINEMVKYTQNITSAEVRGTKRNQTDYLPSQSAIIPQWLGVAVNV